MTERRTVLLGLAGVALAAGCRGEPGPPPKPSGNPADLILHNGTILTMDPALPSAQAVAVVGERIVAVGDAPTVLALRGDQTSMVDLGGRTMLPGFNDAHAHWIGDRNLAWGAPGPEHPAQPTAATAIQAALEVGWTSLTEMFVNAERLDELRTLDSATGLRIRVNAYLPVNYLGDHFGIWFDSYQPGHEYSPYLRLAGAKIFVDRAAPALMYLSRPHSDGDRSLGEVYWSQQQLTDMVTTLVGKGWQIAAHSAGDGAHDLILTAIEAAASRAGSTNPGRHRIEHLIVLRDDQIQRMKNLGVIASFQLTWLTSDWLVVDQLNAIEATLGPQRVRWAGRWRDLLDRGVTATGSTDTPWTGATPLQAVYQAVTRYGYSGRRPTDWMLAQRITVAAALRLLTVGGAYATFQEKEKGTIEVGKLADFVVLSGNPLEVPVNAIPDIAVDLTIVGGRSRFCSPKAGGLCL